MDELPDLPFPVVSMGSFDGVHAGHRVIISRLNTLAREAGGSSVLITFHPHPRKVLYPETAGKTLRLITTLEEKCRVLEETGLDLLIVLEFTKEFSKTKSKDFLEEYLVGKLHAHTIVVGFNHFFGHNKEGNFDLLYQLREKHGFRVEEIPVHEIQNETVSSTKIRKALLDGHIQRANAYLNHHFLVSAGLNHREAESSGFGSNCYGLNIDDPNKLLPPTGAYAVSLQLGVHLQKALVRISPSGILLFPLIDFEMQAGQQAFIHFHKHLGSGLEEGIESDMAKVEELIY